MVLNKQILLTSNAFNSLGNLRELELEELNLIELPKHLFDPLNDIMAIQALAISGNNFIVILTLSAD